MLNSKDTQIAQQLKSRLSQITQIDQLVISMAIPSSVWGSYQINKIWGTSGSNLFIVGDAGSIARYDGSSWQKMESGTIIDLRDVWGTPDGTTVWACGYSNDNSQSLLLKYDGTNWKTVWNVADGPAPYGELLTSLWGQTNLHLSSNRGIYRQDIFGNGTATQAVALNHFPYRIRGSAENNIAVVGDFAIVWHYSGSTWKLLNETNPDQPLYSVAVSTNLIVAVGSDYSTFPNKALIYLGKRVN